MQLFLLFQVIPTKPLLTVSVWSCHQHLKINNNFKSPTSLLPDKLGRPLPFEAQTLGHTGFNFKSSFFILRTIFFIFNKIWSFLIRFYSFVNLTINDLGWGSVLSRWWTANPFKHPTLHGLNPFKNYKTLLVLNLKSRIFEIKIN